MRRFIGILASEKRSSEGAVRSGLAYERVGIRKITLRPLSTRINCIKLSANGRAAVALG
jgi:hypothetical protein